MSFGDTILNRRHLCISPSGDQAVRRFSLLTRLARSALLLCIARPASLLAADPFPGSNPQLRDVHTTDSAPQVLGDTVYLYVGHDEAKGDDFFLMKEWRGNSSKDLRPLDRPRRHHEAH